MTTWQNLAQAMMAFVAGRPNSLRQPRLTAPQQTALARFQRLAKRACQETPPVPGQLQKWGTAVHKRFEELVAAERNPMMFGETGYLDRAVIQSNRRPKGLSYPDAVYGVDPSRPEILWDLKTVLKLIENQWVVKLSANLPFTSKMCRCSTLPADDRATWRWSYPLHRQVPPKDRKVKTAVWHCSVKKRWAEIFAYQPECNCSPSHPGTFPAPQGHRGALPRRARLARRGPRPPREELAREDDGVEPLRRATPAGRYAFAGPVSNRCRRAGRRPRR